MRIRRWDGFRPSRTSGNYHPHGEQVVYPTLVRMAQDFNMRTPLIQPQGNFGTLDDPPAAMRYTEARLAAPAMELMANIDEDTVDFIPNYDDSRTEPTVLPARLPNLLINGAQGIAVGMASSIPPHNLREVCSAVSALLENPEITLDELMEIIPGPDFPTGGMICGRESIREAYETGRARLKIRGICEVEPLKNDKVNLVFTQLPYGVSIKAVSDEIVALVNSKRLTSIADVRDESSLAEGTRLAVELKRGENDRVVLSHLYKHTRLQETFSCINIALVRGRPETLPLKRMLEEFRDHRITVIRRRTRYRLRKAEARAHIVEGLLKALDIIDDIIATIRASHTSAEAKERLMDGIVPTGASAGAAVVTFSRAQADAILEMRLSRLTGLEREKLVAELTELQARIDEYRAILGDRQRVLDIIREDMIELSQKYGDERRTVISDDASEVRMEDLIADDAVAVTISHHGYVKRLALTEYRTQSRGGKGVTGAETKEGDFVERIIITTNHQYLLVLTQTGQLLWLRVFDIPEGSRYSRGRALINMLQVDANDRIAACLPVRSFESGYLLTVTALGRIRKTPLEGFRRPRAGGIIGVRINEGDKLIGAREIDDGQHILLATRKGYAVRFAEDRVRAMGRASAGVRGVRLRDGDEVVGMVVLDDDSEILTVCEKGYGKRTPVADYPERNRGGKGVINIKLSERNGDVIGVRSVTEADEFMMITQGGMVVRTRVSDVRTIGRNTQGVRLMNVDDGDCIVSVALYAPEEEDAAVDGEVDGEALSTGDEGEDVVSAEASAAEAAADDLDAEDDTDAADDLDAEDDLDADDAEDELDEEE